MAAKKEKRTDSAARILSKINSSNQADEDFNFINEGKQSQKDSKLTGIKKDIDPVHLKPHPKNVFNMERDSEYETLKNAIEKYGITNRITCYEDPNDPGEYIILSGHRRTAAAKELGLKRVPVRIVEPFRNKLDELTFLGIENMSTRQPNPMDLAKFADEMSRQIDKEYEHDKMPGRKRDLIAERIPNKQMSPRSVQNYLMLMRLPEAYQKFVEQRIVSVRTGMNIVKIFESEVEGKDAVISEMDARIKSIAEEEIETGDKEKKIANTVKKAEDKIIKKKENEKKKAGRHKNLQTAVNKMMKSVNSMIEDEYEIPKQKAKRREVVEHLDSCIEAMQKVREKYADIYPDD